MYKWVTTVLLIMGYSNSDTRSLIRTVENDVVWRNTNPGQ
jgi:hypothetical protein